MNHFIRTFKQEQTNLLNQIKANGLPIGTVNGIPTAEQGISFSEAQEIIKNEKAYLKESGQFKGDETKIVVSKKLFTKFLELNHELDIFLLSRLDGNAKTWLTMKSKKAKTIKNLEVPKIDFDEWFLMVISFFGCSIFSLSLFGVLTFILTFTDKIACFVLAIVLFAFFFTRLSGVIKDRTEHKKAKKEKDTIQGKDFFMYGHDADDTRGVEQYEGCNMSFSFPKMPDYQRMTSTAIPLDGKIGYIIRKDTPVDIDFNVHHLNCRGAVVPCLILKESIVFYIDYLQLIEGWIMDFGEGNTDGEEVSFEEKKRQIPQIILKPEMFI